MWRELFVCVGLVVCVRTLSLTSPFSFQNAPAALTSLAASASATASGPPEPQSHIANLRRNQQKAQLLQAEKSPLEDDPYQRASAEKEEDNEAAPSLLQKKIGKLLAKLRFISSLSRPAAAGGSSEMGDANESVGASSNNTVTDGTTPAQTETQNTTGSNLDTNISTGNTKENATEKAQTFQKIIYPRSGHGPPIKLSFDVNERIVNRPPPSREEEEESHLELQEVEDTGRLSQIGVFFAEVLGSIVGLIYGAAVQITNPLREGNF